MAKKGYGSFMKNKDFHPSAWCNLKKVYEAKQKKDLEEKRQDELRAQHEKEQDILNNKALLGDEKAKLGLSFMYEAPAGINKKEENKPEPKFEWQRKYNAPREEWAKNNELIQDQPFGIQVRNVRCVKCKTWGHLNTDRECPLYNMSGNSEDPGYANNPSDLIRTIQGEKNRSAPTSSKQAYSDTPSSSKASSSKQSQRSSLKKESSSDSDSSDEYEEAKPSKPIAKAQLANDMAEEHGFKFKNGILHGIRVDEVLLKMSVPIKKEETPTVKTEDEKFEDFVRHMDEKQRSKLLKKVFGGGDSEPEEKSKKKKHKKEHKKEHKKKEKKAKDKKRRHRRDSSTSEDRHKKKRRRRHDSDSE